MPRRAAIAPEGAAAVGAWPGANKPGCATSTAEKTMQESATRPDARGSISRLLRPQSVAIVGASPTPGALGAGVLENLERSRYPGEIHLVNPKRADIRGRPCVATIDALPFGVDCAVLAIPRSAVLDAVKACARRGIGSLVIFSAGFAEGGPGGREDQAEIARIADEHGMVVEGPNCLGMVNYVDGIALTFVQTQPQRLAGRRGIAIVSQSGAMAAVLGVSFTARELGLSFSISTGNEACSSVEDYVDALLDEPNTHAITMIVEQFRKPNRFLALARRARTLGKRIVLLHPGRSRAARASAVTHTGAMTGDYAVMRSLVARTGVILVDSLEQLLDVSEIVLRSPALPTRHCAVMTESGAFKALALDLCEQLGLELAQLSATAQAGLIEALPDFIPPSNPLDLTAQALVDPDLYRRTLAVLLNEDQVGCVVLGIILTDKSTCDLKLPHILGALQSLAPRKCIVFAGLDEGAAVPSAYVDEFRAQGVPFFTSAERALRAVSCLAAPTPADPGPPGAQEAVPLLADATGVLAEYTSKEVLRSLGIPVPAGRLVRRLDQALAAAAAVGYPVVLKAQSPHLAHKSDAGGVVLGLETPQALERGWQLLHANMAAARAGLELDGVLVERMCRKGLELIVGARNDPDWGPVLLVGFGGVLAELLHDVRTIPANLSAADIAMELAGLKGADLFDGLRGEKALDVAAAASLVARVGRLIRADTRILEIDVNPVVVYPAGEGAVALDALIVMAPA